MLCIFIVARFTLDFFMKGPILEPLSGMPKYDELDPESLLASGGRLPIACSDQSSLELISGVSHSLSEELLRARSSIQNLARRLGDRAALLTIHGVGEKRVERLLTFLDPGGRCSKTLPYAPFSPKPQGTRPVR